MEHLGSLRAFRAILLETRGVDYEERSQMTD
jgi:hypothetical protein